MILPGPNRFLGVRGEPELVMERNESWFRIRSDTSYLEFEGDYDLAVSCGVGRSQTWLGSHVAVAVVWAGGYSSNSTPSLGISIYHVCGPKNRTQR